MPTASGLQQHYTPVSLLTATAFAQYAGTPQWMIPILLSTARPDGDVVHEVQYGQTLRSLAISYGTRIEEIKRLNNLSADVITTGQKLLILKEATQPAPSTPTGSHFEPVRQDLRTPTPRATFTLAGTAVTPATSAGQFIKQNSIVMVAFIISFSVLVAVIVGAGRSKKKD